MRIAFSPALGETVHVSANGVRKSTTQLHFTATIMSLADYEQVASGRVKLQVWSDVPANGRTSGEWGEADFNPVPSSPPSEHEFSFLPQEEARTSLTLDFSVPVSGQRFSFTYRMVYPTGEIKWLGQYGENGTLVLDRIDSHPVLLGEGWVPGDNGSYRRDSDGPAVQDLEVARLARPADYTAYAVAENSFLYPKNSALVVLSPRLSSHPVILPPTLIFGTTPSGSISFSRGAITMSGSGSLLFVACESAGEVELAMSMVIDHCSSPRVRVVSYTHGAATLASAADKYSVEVAIIPMASSNLLIQSSLPLRSLASLVPGGSQFCVFVHRKALFFSGESAEASDESISFSVGQSGAQFIVAPAERVDHGEERWQVAIVSSFAATSLPEPTEGLPTPPPSPRLRPLPHRISETIAQSPDPSVLSLPAPISSDERSPSGSSSNLVLHSAAQRRAGVLAFLRHIFFVFFTWFARIFRRPRPTVQPKRIASERTPLLQEEANYVQPRVEVTSTAEQEDTQFDEQPPVTSSSMLADVGGGNITIVFKAAHSFPLFNVPIQLNGQAADFNVQRTADGIFVVDFSSSAGGRLNIGW